MDIEVVRDGNGGNSSLLILFRKQCPRIAWKRETYMYRNVKWGLKFDQLLEERIPWTSHVTMSSILSRRMRYPRGTLIRTNSCAGHAIQAIYPIARTGYVSRRSEYREGYMDTIERLIGPVSSFETWFHDLPRPNRHVPK